MKLKMAIVGFGGMARAHLEHNIPRSDFELKGIYDIKQEVCDYARQNNIFVYQSLDEIIKDEEISLVLIATPNDVHHPVALKLLNAKKNVLCEKPAALNSKQLDEMICCANDNNVVFTVNQNRRYDSDFLTAKKVIEESPFGEVFHLESKVYGSRGIPGDWRTQKKHGGGMIFDWGIHLVDQVLQISKFELKSLYAQTTYITGEECDDGFRILFTFKSGATALVEVGTSYFYEQPRWYLSATNGTVIIGEFENTWKETAIVKSLTTNEKLEVKPVRAANGFTKTMAPRDENMEVEIQRLDWILGDPIEIYNNIANLINGEETDLVINHQSLNYTFKIIEDIFESAEKNIVITY